MICLLAFARDTHPHMGPRQMGERPQEQQDNRETAEKQRKSSNTGSAVGSESCRRAFEEHFGRVGGRVGSESCRRAFDEHFGQVRPKSQQRREIEQMSKDAQTQPKTPSCEKEQKKNKERAEKSRARAEKNAGKEQGNNRKEPRRA